MKKIISLFLSLSALLVLSGCWNSASKQQKLVMGISADNPPFTFQQGRALVGFEIDLAKKICELLEYELEIKDMDFASLIPAVKSGVVDFSFSSFTETPERAKNVSFTKPYFYSNVIILAKTEFVKLSEFDNKTIGVQLGTFWETYVENLKVKYPSIKIVSFNKIGQLFQELSNDTLDMVIGDESVARNAQKHHPTFRLSTVENIGQPLQGIFPLNSPLLDSFNDIIEQLQEDGFIEELEKTWLTKD